MKNKSTHNKYIYIFLLFLFVILWAMPWSLAKPAMGLDPSWKMAFGWAIQHHIQFGKDFIWTYGPLGFIIRPIFYPDHILWAIALSFCWFFSILLIFILIFLYSSYKIELIIVSFSLICFLPFISIATILILLSLIILFYSYKYENKINLVFYGILLAIASLIKVSHIFTAIILLFFPLLLEKNQKRIKWLIPIIVYIISFLLLWIITGQKISNIISFIYYSFYLVKGYSSAMAIHGEKFQTVIAILILFIILSLILLSLIKKKEFAKYLIITFPVVFEYFKEGFVRHDPGYFGHADIFFSFIALFFIIIYLKADNDFIIKFKKKLPITLAFFLFFPLIGIYYNCPKAILPNTSKFLSFKQSLYLLTSYKNRNKFQKSVKQQMRKSLQIPHLFIKKIGNSSVNIIPWDLNIAYAYNLKLLPSPIIQSYSVYTPQLDKANAFQINHGKPAKFIIYKLETIDGRYPLYDEPATFRAILFHYKVWKCINQLCLMERRSKIKKNNLKLIKLKNINAKLGEPINVPKFSNGYEFANITIHYSLFGKFMNIIYKDSPIYIKFITNKAFIKSNKYRFIQKIGDDGIFVTEYIDNNINTFRNIFLRKIYSSKILKQIIFTTNLNFEYNRNIKISFYGYKSKYFKIIKTLPAITYSHGNIPLWLNNNQSVSGKIKISERNALNNFKIHKISVFIGNGMNSADGLLKVKLCDRYGCSYGAKSVKKSLDNNYFTIPLIKYLIIGNDKSIKYEFIYTHATKPVAIWLWPTTNKLNQYIQKNNKKYEDKGFKINLIQ